MASFLFLCRLPCIQSYANAFALLLIGIHGKYTRTGATTWLENTATFEELARILRERNTVVWFLEQTIEELNENLRYRREVTAFFRGYPSQVGSRFWLENNRHQHFNERVLGKVLEILIHMQDARR